VSRTLLVILAVCATLLGEGACAAEVADLQRKPVAATAAKPQTEPAAAAAAKPKPQPKPKKIVEIELTGVTSQVSDQVYARLRHEYASTDRNWSVRTGYTLTSSKSYSTKGVNKTETSTMLLDGRYAKERGRDYAYGSASVNLRLRDTATSQYPKKSGYHLIAGGVGRKLGGGVEGDLGLGVLTTYDDTTETDPALVTSVRARLPVGKRLTFDGQVYGMLPDSGSLEVDSDLTLNYKLTSELFLRLGWSATNLMQPIKDHGEWDVVTRLSFLFRK